MSALLPCPGSGRADNRSEPALRAAIGWLYGALIATSHAARSPGLQTQRPACNALGKESRAGLYARTSTCVRLRPALADKAFCPVTSLRWQLGGFGGRLGWGRGTEGWTLGTCSPRTWWGALGAPAVPPAARGVLVVKPCRCQGRQGGLEALSTCSPAAWELMVKRGENGGKGLGPPPALPTAPLGCCDFIEAVYWPRESRAG